MTLVQNLLIHLADSALLDYPLRHSELRCCINFTVEITETLQRLVEIDATDEVEAERIVRERYRKGEIVLDGARRVGKSYIAEEFAKRT